MLLPRPEIRIATRLGSRIVSRGPVLRRVPRAGLAVDGAAALTRFDAPDLHGRGGARRARNFRRDDHGHADAAVERPRHLLGRDVPAALEEREDRRQLPALGIDYGVTTFRQNPRNILEKPAARDV